MAFTPGSTPDKQSRVARESQNQGQIDGPLPLISRGGLPVVTRFDYPNPRAAARAATDTYSVCDASEVWLFGTDAMAAGRQSTELPPRAAARARDYSITASVNLTLLGQDAMTVGVQSTALPPRGAQRAADYTFVQALPINLLVPVGQQSTELAPRAAARARDYSHVQTVALNLLGQDAMAAGRQSFELPPHALAAPRARDYTFAQSAPLNLLGRDAMVTGQQLSGNAPAGARRASTLGETGANLTLIASQAPPVVPCGLSTLASELPPRAMARARDYSLGASFPLELIGKDQLFGAPGQVPAYDWSYQPPKPRYQQGTGEPVQDLLGTLLAAAAAPVGVQVFDLPRGAPRARDYTFSWALQLVLLAPVGSSSVELPPLGAARSRDYTWLQSFALAVFQQLPPGRTSEPSVGPPRGPARARDYTIGASFPLELIGRDAMTVGEQSFELAPRAAPRLREYTHLASYALANTTPTRDLAYVLGSPRGRWRTGEPSSAWSTLPPTQRWRIEPAQE